MEINKVLNELLVNLFKDINDLEEKAIQVGEYKNVTTNDMHVIDAIGIEAPKNMSSVAKRLDVTMGTLTISVNSLVKKGYVQRVRSEEDRRVVFISLTDAGKRAYEHHQKFHQNMIQAVLKGLDEEQKYVLEKALSNLNDFFKQI